MILRRWHHDWDRRAVICLPFVIAAAGKSNLITFVTRVSHQELQAFHRRTSYASCVLTLLHTFPRIRHLLPRLLQGLMLLHLHTWTLEIYSTGTGEDAKTKIADGQFLKKSDDAEKAPDEQSTEASSTSCIERQQPSGATYWHLAGQSQPFALQKHSLTSKPKLLLQRRTCPQASWCADHKICSMVYAMQRRERSHEQ